MEMKQISDSTIKITIQLEDLEERGMEMADFLVPQEKTEELANFPDVVLDLKKLKGTKSGYRLRVGNYRILFDVIDGVPVVIEIKAVMKRSERTYN